ncbi:aldehyde-activating protein [Novosphingobium sp. PC22D]|uniref:GFA family protein n=1 Tax=Novosphingobium sp. PC22D TaxID=1962403 RepID=UPI000BEFD4B4|nr:GFA family protein [Novosphingobium sp. PC22D]PEQ13199.1 aldehyde-activating protein [Novosphingobium sp. PC22D]
MTRTLTGGCQCGRIRYTARLENDDAGLCHCAMCRKATGGIAGTFVEVATDAVTWDHEPDAYDSSPIAQRLFCGRCGSPLGWRPRKGERMDLMVGGFDDPSRFRPVAHAGAERIIEAWLDTSALPRYETTAIASTVALWKDAGREVPE